jgi:hypothetical protein
MPFIVYQTTKLPSGALRYHKLEHVTLAGGGLIQSTLRTLGRLGKGDAGWTVSAAELLRTGGYEPDAHALVIDTAPSRDTVSLFEVQSMLGYSYADWTPIMVRFEQLFVDEDPTTSVDAMKQEFTDEASERCVVRTILYLKGGYAGGDWNWGGNSRTTAALLWEDAWKFFQTG